MALKHGSLQEILDKQCPGSYSSHPSRVFCFSDGIAVAINSAAFIHPTYRMQNGSLEDVYHYMQDGMQVHYQSWISPDT